MSKTTLQDIRTKEDANSNKKQTNKDYNRPNVIHAKQTEFYGKVIVTLPSQFSISKIEKMDFKCLGMRLTQSDDFSVSITQDSKSIKELPVGVDSFSKEEKKSHLKSLVGQLLYLDLTRPDLAFMISDLSRSSSKTSDERL